MQARVCQRRGKPLGVFAHTLIRNGKAERGYYHPPCFTKEKKESQNETDIHS
jgi:hypothetical protein